MWGWIEKWRLYLKMYQGKKKKKKTGPKSWHMLTEEFELYP